MAATESGGASNTVYVRNLEETIKIPTLTSSLRELFEEYGTIIDLVAKKSLKRKGQAFVVFDNPDSAANAIEEIQGFELFDKPMVLEFANTPSDATVKMNGTEDDYESHRRRRLAEKERKQAVEQQQAEAQSAKLKRAQPQPDAEADQGQGARPVKSARGAGLKSTAGAPTVVPDEYLPPNKILFLQGVPEEYDVDALTAIFARFEGFKEVRLVPGRKGLAFVEYDAETGAISAKESTGGMTLGDEGKPIKVTYQRQ